MSEENVETKVAIEEAETTSPTDVTQVPESGEASTSKTESETVTTEVAAKEEEDITMDESDEDKKQRACRQIEFYFSDSNLPYDRFMWTLHTANDDHWVPIDTVASFKRMREYKPLGTPWLVAALKSSTQLEVDESETKIRRRNEVQEPKGQFERSIYAKGFGKETPDLQKKLEVFFNKYGYCNAVRMRRDDEKQFKGSVFVEFSDQSSVDAFLNADPKPSWGGEELLIMTKEAYCEMKIKEKGIKGQAATVRREQNRSSGIAGNARKGFNAFKEMSKSKNAVEKDKPKPEVYLEFMGYKIRVYEEESEGRVKDEDVPHVKGSVLMFKGLEGEAINMKDVKEKLQERFDRPPFVKYTKESEYGLLAFNKALSEEDVAYVKEKLPTISEKEVTWAPAEEEDEKNFLLERARFAAKRAYESTLGSGSSSGRGGGRGGRGGRGRGRGRGGGGGRGGHRDRDGGSSDKTTTKTEGGASDEQAGAGEKRKRTIEPDGSSDVGTRGARVPVVQGTKMKRVKTEDGGEGGAGGAES